MPLFGFDDTMSSLAFQPDRTNVTASDLQAAWNPIEFPNIHVFSYLGLDPGINVRVVYETALVVEYLTGLPP